MILHLVNQIDNTLQSINFLGFEIDKWILILYLHLCIPLGFLFSKINSPTQRLWFNLICGQLFAMVICKEWYLEMNVWALVIYVITINFKKCVLPVSLAAFAIMSYIHVYRQYYEYLSWKMDYNTVQMMLTARYIFYAVDKQDSKVEQSFLMYISYIFMFPNLIIAPVPYKNFANLINRTEDLSGFKYKFALISCGKAMLFSLGEVFIRPHIDTEWFWTKDWEQMNIISKTILLLLIGICLRFQYFAAFFYSQATMDAIGITYNPKTKKNDRLTVAYYSYELQKNAVLITQKWNCNVQNWLKYCFYDRINKQYGSNTFYITFLISCVWHGFYLSYYLFFIFWALLIQVCKYIYKASQQTQLQINSIFFLSFQVERSQFTFLHYVFHILAWLGLQISIDTIAMGMKLLDWDKGIQFFNSMYWYPQILILTLFMFFNLTKYGQKSKQGKQI